MTAPGKAPIGGQTSSSLGGAWHRVTHPDTPTTRKVVAIAWPVVVTNLLQSLALTVDLIMIASLGVVAQASMGVATQVFFLGMTIAAGLAAGATALVARGFGAGDQAESDRAGTAAVVLAVGLSVPLILFTYFFDAPLLRFMTLGSSSPDTEAIVQSGSIVLRALAWGIPGYMLMTTATGALQGAGDTRPALFVGLAVNAVNLALDYALIYGKFGFPKLGLEGAAWATSASYTAGGLAFLWLLSKGGRPVRLRRSGALFRSTARRVLRVGGPAFAEQFVLNAGFLAYLLVIVDLGAASVSAHQIGLRVQAFAFMPGFGLAAAAAALVGQGLGRGKPEDAKRDAWASNWLGLVVMMGLSVPMFFLARPLASLFTDDPEALHLSVIWIRTIVFAMPAIAFHFTMAGALRGAGDTRWPLFVSFGGIWLLRLPIAYVLGIQLGFGMAGVWAGYVLEYYVRAVVTTLRFRRGAWKDLKV